jgi:hypothetical protein
MPDRVCRNADSLFDCDAFRHAVESHLRRWNISRTTLAELADVDGTAVFLFLNGQRPTPSLLMVLALADVCDLSVDRYRRPPKEN